MSKLTVASALVLFVSSSLVEAATYSCSSDAPQMLVEEGAAVSLRNIGIPASALQSRVFTIILTPQKNSPIQRARVTWAGDPFQAAGNFAAIPTGQGTWSVMTLSAGPCLFTETACTNNIQIIDQSDTSAEVLILPTAFTTTDEQQNIRKPFVGFIRGRCSKAAKP